MNTPIRRPLQEPCSPAGAHQTERAADTPAPIFTCSDDGMLRYRGTFYGDDTDMFRRLRAIFEAEPSEYGRRLTAEIDAALARYEQIHIEEVA